MKKKLSLLVALTMMLGSMAGLAEEAKQGPTEAELLAKPCEFSLIEANGEQPRLTYIEGVTPILEVDGYKFKDMNKNGKLDPYEDWRLDTETRVNDLISQMTPEEEAGLLFCVSANLETARSLIPDFNLTCMLFNLNGTPDNVVSTLNNLQAAAEKERLGVPMIFTSDREFNAWGGYIDKAHIAYGTANDPELAYKLSNIYGKAMVAVGIHVTFEPYANEIGAQYGENPEHIANIVYQEVKGMEDAGFASCVKHWIGRLCLTSGDFAPVALLPGWCGAVTIADDHTIWAGVGEQLLHFPLDSVVPDVQLGEFGLIRFLSCQQSKLLISDPWAGRCLLMDTTPPYAPCQLYAGECGGCCFASCRKGTLPDWKASLNEP